MMLIRSSSTPILGSLLPSESPNNNSSHAPNHTFHPHHHNTNNKLPPRHYYSHSSSTNNYYNNSSFHSSSSPISPSISDISSHAYQGTPPPPQTAGFRRAQSESNLEQLYLSNDFDEFNNSVIPPPKTFSRMKTHYSSALQSIPSFSYSRSRNEEEEEEDDDLEEEEEETEETYQGDKVFGMKGTTDRKFNLEQMEKSFNAAYNNASAYGDSYMGHNQNSDGMMHLAMGPGVGVIDGFGGGTGGGGDGWNVNSRHTGSGGGGHGGDGATSEDANDMMDEHYKRMVDENPGNALFLRNYADFLHKSKKDLKGAEEYYSRSILADPTDGEVLSQYAKLVWDLHRDEDRATSYFERAVKTAPQDSHVHAAYASFLWEIEAVDENDQNDLDLMAPGDNLREGTMATVGA